jgi:hypothetical protein
MTQFQVLALALLTAITFELGLIAVKLPTPAAHAAFPQQPAPSLEDPHETLKRQINELQRELGRVSQSVEKVSQNVQMVTAAQERIVYRVNDESKRLLVTCFMMSVHFAQGLSNVFKTDNGSSLERCTARSPWGGSGTFMGNYDVPFGP